MNYTAGRKTIELVSSSSAGAKNEIEPGAIQRDEEAAFPLDICRKLGELGLMGILVPEEYGGSGMDVTSFAIAVESIARYDGSTALSVQAHNGLSCGHILKAACTGRERKRRRRRRREMRR